jgi:serine/threonine protein phosphatase 1
MRPRHRPTPLTRSAPIGPDETATPEQDPRVPWRDEFQDQGWFDHRPPEELLGQVPDDWTVWAFADPHGVASGLRTALREAGLIDADDRWIAPPGTALVGCGDYIDRGWDSRGCVDLLRRLEREAGAAGGGVWLTRGNHEHLLDHLANGGDEILDHWLTFGGVEALASYGYAAPLDDPRRILEHLRGAAPELLPWIGGLRHAVRWRDVLFVHGGLVPGAGPEDLGQTTDRHLWIRRAFFDTPWSSGAFDGFRRAGIERVVYGHTPLPHGPRLSQDGRILGLDTNACRIPTMPADAIAQVTLVRLEGDVALGDAPLVEVRTDDAPDRQGGR